MVEGGDLLTITVLVLAHLIIGQSTILQLNFNSSGVSWESAANECGHYGLENDQHILRNMHELEGRTFWIGEKVYHVTLPWMEILGCFAVNNISSTHSNTSLGQCQRQSRVSTYFGYKEETRECVCLRERGHNGRFDNCINRTMGSSFFVYTNFSDSNFGSDPADGKNCMTSNCTFEGHVDFVKVYCNTTDSSVKGVCEDGSPATAQSFWGKNKSVIMERCRRNHKLLPSSTFCNGTGVRVWTNVFRVEEDFEFKTDDAGNYKPIGCVAATLNNSVLYKRRISCDDDVKYFVCKQMEPTTLQPDVTASTGFILNITSTPSRPTVGAIAGGIVGFLVVVSLTLISLMMCRRRQVCMFQLKKNPSNMSYTYADISNTTSSSLKGSTDADVNGSITVNNEIFSGNFHADLVYSKEEAHQNSNTIDTESSLDLDCYDHLNARNKRKTMLNENLYSSNVGVRSNTDPTYDYSTMGTNQQKDVNSMYDHTLESMNSNNVGFRNNTDPTYDDSTMCTIQGKDSNNMYDHTLEHMDSTCSNIDDVYAVSSKLKPTK